MQLLQPLAASQHHRLPVCLQPQQAGHLRVEMHIEDPGPIIGIVIHLLADQAAFLLHHSRTVLL